MYESPIHLLVQQLETSIREQQEKQIFEAIQKCGVDVDRDELIKALSYDRDQYDKGYADGRADAQRWISVEDDLPAAVIAPCLVYFDGDTYIADWSHDKYSTDWWFYVDGEYEPLVTHWMPLPEPPEEE